MSLRRRLAGIAGCVVLLAGCTGVPRDITPVTGFDAQRYAGTWYEIARLDHRFERGLTNVSATYTLRDDGRVGVVNRGYDTEDCEWQSVDGSAKFRGDPRTASLAVTFQWPFAGGYHVFALDETDYRWAIVSGPTREYLWILAREPRLAPELQTDLVARARAAGFAVERLIMVEHGEPRCARPAGR